MGTKGVGRVRRQPVPLLTEMQLAGLAPELREVIEYRKSGLSVNWIIGCPLDCGYCVRHLFGNFVMKFPRALTRERQAVELLVEHEFFQPNVTPIQLLNRATDPMLPVVKPHTMRMLRLLDDRGLTNHVLVITRWRIDPDDCAELNALRHLKVTMLVTYSGIEDERVEPVDSRIAAASVRTAFEHAERFRVVLYWRPIVPGLNDTDSHLRQALELSHHAHATVYTGLFYRDEIRRYYRDHGLPEPFEETARRKILPGLLEQRILTAANEATGSPLFRKTSCAVTYAHGEPDYNGHFGIRELCDICPAAQRKRCALAWSLPEPNRVEVLVERCGGELVEVTDRAVVVAGLDEQRRYLIQHTLGYQVHDVTKPHHLNRHGRADLGYPYSVGATA